MRMTEYTVGRIAFTQMSTRKIEPCTTSISSLCSLRGVDMAPLLYCLHYLHRTSKKTKTMNAYQVFTSYPRLDVARERVVVRQGRSHGFLKLKVIQDIAPIHAHISHPHQPQSAGPGTRTHVCVSGYAGTITHHAGTVFIPPVSCPCPVPPCSRRVH